MHDEATNLEKCTIWCVIQYSTTQNEPRLFLVPEHSNAKRNHIWHCGSLGYTFLFALL